MEIINRYLPKSLSDNELKQEIENIINQAGATSMQDMGRVMGLAAKAMAGKADGKRISVVVKNALGR